DLGRFKPDVVAPGTFVVSTRSTEWDTAAYYNPTSHVHNSFRNLVAQTNILWASTLFVQDNAIQVNIDVFPNADSPVPFPDLPIFMRYSAIPSPTPGGYDFIRTNHVAMPPDGGALTKVGVNWGYGVGNSTTQAVAFDLATDQTVTNDLGNYLDV